MPAADPIELLDSLILRTRRFQDEALEALPTSARFVKPRIRTLEQSRKQLAQLSPLQEELLQESLKCIEFSLFRSAHVSAWQAYVDMLSDKIASDGFHKLSAIRTKWPSFSTVEDLREYASEHEMINVARELKLLSKAEAKILHGLLSKRNECAHPSSYSPGANETIGFVSELLSRMKILSGKSL